MSDEKSSFDQHNANNADENAGKYYIYEAAPNQVAPEAGGEYSTQYQQYPYASGDTDKNDDNYNYYYQHQQQQHQHQQQQQQQYQYDSFQNQSQDYSNPDPFQTFMADFVQGDFEKEDVYAPTAEQKEKLKEKLRNKFRNNLTFDWLGQKDFNWYSSWMMSQGNFIGFRVLLTLFVFNCWWKLVSVFAGFTWTNVMEVMMDFTSFLRFSFTIFALSGVLIGIGGSTMLSICKLCFSPKQFKLLCQYKTGKDLSGLVRSFLIFTVNHLYDAGMIFAAIPIVLIGIPEPLVMKKIALSPWNTFTLPLLVLMDLWITKRCRCDSDFINRHLPIFTFLLFVFSVLWTIACMFISYFFGIYHSFSDTARIMDLWDLEEDHIVIQLLKFQGVYPILVGVFQNTILFISYLVIGTFGAEWLQDFHRFKANYLLMNHVNDFSIKDANDHAKNQEKHYKAKIDAFESKLAEERAKLFAEDNKQADNFETNDREETVESVPEVEESDTGAGVRFGSLTGAKSHKTEEEQFDGNDEEFDGNEEEFDGKDLFEFNDSD